MWAGIVYGALLEHHGDHILLDTYLKVTYTEINGRKVARGILQSDSFRALDVTP